MRKGLGVTPALHLPLCLLSPGVTRLCHHSWLSRGKSCSKETLLAEGGFIGFHVGLDGGLPSSWSLYKVGKNRGIERFWSVLVRQLFIRRVEYLSFGPSLLLKWSKEFYSQIP